MQRIRPLLDIHRLTTMKGLANLRKERTGTQVGGTEEIMVLGLDDLTSQRNGTRLPLYFSWSQPDRPLPRREVRVPARGHRTRLGVEPPPWLRTGQAGEPFPDSAARPAALGGARTERS